MNSPGAAGKSVKQLMAERLAEHAKRKNELAAGSGLLPGTDSSDTARCSSKSSDSNGKPTVEVSTRNLVPPVAAAESRTEHVVTKIQPSTVIVLERPGTGDGLQSSTENARGTGAALEVSSQETETDTDLDVTNPIHFAFLNKLKQVEEALLARDPLMKTHLGEIHKAMIQHEEIVNLLRTHEIAKIMAAQQVHTNTILIRDTVKKAKTGIQAKAAKLGLEDV